MSCLYMGMLGGPQGASKNLGGPSHLRVGLHVGELRDKGFRNSAAAAAAARRHPARLPGGGCEGIATPTSSSSRMAAGG